MLIFFVKRQSVPTGNQTVLLPPIVINCDVVPPAAIISGTSQEVHLPPITVECRANNFPVPQTVELPALSIRVTQHPARIRIPYDGFIQSPHYFGDKVKRRIEAGKINIFYPYHTVVSETGTSDNVDTITGGEQGQTVSLQVGSPSETITLKAGTGNLSLGNNDIVMAGDSTIVELQFDGSRWVPV